LAVVSKIQTRTIAKLYTNKRPSWFQFLIGVALHCSLRCMFIPINVANYPQNLVHKNCGQKIHITFEWGVPKILRTKARHYLWNEEVATRFTRLNLVILGQMVRA